MKFNGLIIDNPSKKISTGDKINLEIPKPEEANLKPYKFDLNIVHEDEDLLSYQQTCWNNNASWGRQL